MTETTQKLTAKDRWAYALFWSWNLIFLAFVVLGFAPQVLPELATAVRTGLVPLQYLSYGLVLTLIPVAAIILGLTVLRRYPGRLFALGYVVEGPLMLILAVRFFIIREASPGLTLLMAIAILGMAAFLWYLLDPELERRPRWMGWLRLVGLTLMLLTSLYAALWIAFYALPLAAWVWEWLVHTIRDLYTFWFGFSRSIRDLFQQELIWLPFILLGFLLLLYTATLFVLAPVAVPWLSLRAWWRSLQAQVSLHGRLFPAALTIITVLVCALLFVLTNHQPQKQAFALLSAPPKSSQDAQALLTKSEIIRAGLLNAYLAPFRFVSAMGEVRHISDIYEDIFGMTREQAFGVQRLYENVARPLLYDPVHPQSIDQGDNRALVEEPQEAAKLYQRMFDQPIVDGEREAIVRAVRSTYSAQQAEAAWQAVDDREVRLERQELTINEHGDWADIELYEVYRNQTANPQEVIYYFNLPESAVITGIWLGNSPDRSERFAYQVAPRGAAQAVYREETRRMRDPALVEQIGPRQYRLRVFPIPPLQMRWDEDRNRTFVEEADALHMWLTYRTVASQGAWPLPQLAVLRNVYWDDHTVRQVNGSSIEVASDDWLPPALPTLQPATPASHRVDFLNGESVVAVPADQVELPALPSGLRLALVLDRSYSMAGHAVEVEQEIEHLKQSVGPGATIDVYLTSSPFRGEPPSMVSIADLDLQGIQYFGGQNAAELLSQFEALRAGRAYDAVLVFTDGSGYELGESTVEVPVPTAPVWMVHLGSDLPLGYDDQTLEAIQASGGGVVGDLDMAFQRLALALLPASNSSGEAMPPDVLDGYVWSVLPTEQARASDIEASDSSNGFSTLAARRLIQAQMQKNRGSLKDLEALDQLHAIAKAYGIVTPYSSMIVLVNLEQQSLLKHLEEGSDRFEREFEELKETTPSTQLPLAGVPEPHEWLLIGLAGALLLYYGYTRRKSYQHQGVIN